MQAHPRATTPSLKPWDLAQGHDELVRLRPWLEGLARRRLHNPQMAQDAVSETMLAGLETCPELSGVAALKAWLAGVLRHKVVDQLRRFGPRAVVVADDDAVEAAALHWEGPVGAATDPLALLERREFLAALDRALAQLPPREAQAFLMREVQQASTEAICTALAVKPGHLWVISHRGRRHLRILLEAWRPAQAPHVAGSGGAVRGVNP